MTNKNATEFCYQLMDREECTGPFEFSDIAMAEAKKELLAEGYHLPAKVRIGQVLRADPVEHTAGMDADTVIDAMEQHAFDNGFQWCDAQVFDLKLNAVWALQVALKQWARDWVTSTKWTMVCDHEWLLGIDHEWHQLERPKGPTT